MSALLLSVKLLSQAAYKLNSRRCKNETAESAAMPHADAPYAASWVNMRMQQPKAETTVPSDVRHAPVPVLMPVLVLESVELVAAPVSECLRLWRCPC